MSELEELYETVRKKYGEKAITPATESRENTTPRLSTGTFILDYAMGGGIPIGRFSMTYGHKSAGKSALAAKVAVSAQQTCRYCLCRAITEPKEVEYIVKGVDNRGCVVEETRKRIIPSAVECHNKCRVVVDGKKRWPGPMHVLWNDAEGTFSVGFYTMFGLDCSKVSLITPESAEQSVDLIDAALQTGDIDLTVLDSVAKMVPEKEREAASADQHMAIQARLMNKALRQWQGSMNEIHARKDHNVTVFAINQVRMKIGGFMPCETRPGGMGWEFDSSLDIKLWQDGSKCFEHDSRGRALWMFSKFRIEKNKVSTPKSEGRYRMCVTEQPGRLPGDTWDDEVVVDMAVENKMFVRDPDKKGSFLCMGRPYESEDALRAHINQKDEFYYELRRALLDLLVTMPSDGQLAKKKEKKEDDD